MILALGKSDFIRKSKKETDFHWMVTSERQWRPKTSYAGLCSEITGGIIELFLLVINSLVFCVEKGFLCVLLCLELDHVVGRLATKDV